VADTGNSVCCDMSWRTERSSPWRIRPSEMAAADPDCDQFPGRDIRARHRQRILRLNPQARSRPGRVRGVPAPSSTVMPRPCGRSQDELYVARRVRLTRAGPNRTGAYQRQIDLLRIPARPRTSRDGKRTVLSRQHAAVILSAAKDDKLHPARPQPEGPCCRSLFALATDATGNAVLPDRNAGSVVILRPGRSFAGRQLAKLRTKPPALSRPSLHQRQGAGIHRNRGNTGSRCSTIVY